MRRLDDQWGLAVGLMLVELAGSLGFTTDSALFWGRHPLAMTAGMWARDERSVAFRLTIAYSSKRWNISDMGSDNIAEVIAKILGRHNNKLHTSRRCADRKESSNQNR